MPETSRTCRTCDLSFDTAEEQRRHAKNEWHVYRLRCRVAPPGTIIQPPPTAPDQHDTPAGEKSQTESGPPANSSRVPNDSPELDDEESSSGNNDDGDDGDEDSEEKQTPDFVKTECLFCNRASESFDNNMQHMLRAHSLIIPYSDFLAVDLETLVWYLHFVINGYHECILCGKRRNTLQAVQQHMLGKGHCRFDITGDYADFYDLDSVSSVLSSLDSSDFVRPDEGSMRLPSGKLLTHRAHVSAARENRPQLSSQPSNSRSRRLDSAGPMPSRSDINALDRTDRRAAGLAIQLSALSLGDRNSLSHLTAPEQRSALTTRKKQLERAQRDERRARSKVERKGNKTLMKTFVADVPGARPNG